MTLTDDAPTADEMLGEALVLRGWGWCPFPVDSHKKPLVRWKSLQRRRPNDRDIARMFRIPGVGGVAVITGQASGGLVNRDFDVESSYHRWAADHPPLASTAPTIRTRRGYRVCIRSRVATYRKLDDGEVIGDDRHFVILPPSHHPSGTSYSWLNGPPLGLSEFPLLDPVAAGFIPSQPQPFERRKSKATLDAQIPLREDTADHRTAERLLPGRPSERCSQERDPASTGHTAWPDAMLRRGRGPADQAGDGGSCQEAFRSRCRNGSRCCRSQPVNHSCSVYRNRITACNVREPNGADMTVNELPPDLRRWAEVLRDTRAVLLHKPRGSKRWRRIGIYDDVVAAMIEADARIAKGETGSWKAERLKKLPRDESDED